MPKKTAPDTSKLDKAVSDARKYADERSNSYREKALGMYPWICGRCQREFVRENLSELTVHHRNHDHDDNPQDGSNWELLCLYCHDNEHQRYEEACYAKGSDDKASTDTAFKAFAGLGDLLKDK
ncbi:MAG: HNH nuclease family protein [Methylococcales bacterium]|jgi:hypothetical protein|nr:HNH nuclease family protein [Methylococcales bacterium]MBT7444867.1 HNH nuclease family protein [Methylococcales bacterium]